MGKATLRLNTRQRQLLRQAGAIALLGLFLLLLARSHSFTGETWQPGSGAVTGYRSESSSPAASPGTSSPAATSLVPARSGSAGSGAAAGGGEGAASVMDTEGLDSYRRELEEILEATLSQVAGAGGVEVFVSLADSGRVEVMASETREVSRSEERESQSRQRSTLQDRLTREPRLVRRGQEESPVVTRRLRPEIAGVLVIAEGAVRDEVRLELSQAVATALGLPSHRVAVLPRAMDRGGMIRE
ncbi:MAG TPA: hypothetical protein GXX55_08530 [Firmicutes bacterium]|nr:hypothetical protein [Bacillota bacterium]